MVDEENEDLYNQQNKLIKEYQELKQEICKHGIWYYLESEEDPYERRTYVECKCIKCGIEKTFRNYEIKNIGTLIQEDHYEKCLNSYKEVVEFYNDLLGFSMDSEDANKLMIKRFNNRKVTNK